MVMAPAVGVFVSTVTVPLAWRARRNEVEPKAAWPGGNTWLLPPEQNEATSSWIVAEAGATAAASAAAAKRSEAAPVRRRRLMRISLSPDRGDAVVPARERADSPSQDRAGHTGRPVFGPSAQLRSGQAGSGGVRGRASTPLP